MIDESYEGIAIVGMAGRFPGAETAEELWANLVEGKESVSFFTDEELAESGLDAAVLRSRGHYVPARGILKDADCFDAAFFGVHPKEAEVMDPQHRLFLEICWMALEQAGYAPNQIRSSVGVFAGATFNTYYLHALHHRQDLRDLVGPELVMFGNERDYLTTRVAYKLGLKGPAVNVSTACSTSLVAVGQACQSLLTYQCDMALAGGVSVTVPQKRGYVHDEGNIGSADGHTRTFDAQSSGTAFGNGVAAVVLKRLADAVNDADRVYAVIKAAALNNDGSQRVSFGAPGVEGQSEVIAMAHALAGVDPETITYVEAHGTATPLGDPIEVAGLTKAFRLGTEAKQFCALGSVKTNLGHLDAAAGVTGLIKTALSLHHRIIPASLHFTKPNPKLDLENSPFYVNATRQDWKAQPGVPRRAGVSAFGTGGTNAHVVLEEAPETPASGPSRAWQLLIVSAKAPDALDRATTNLVEHLRLIGRPDGPEAARQLADAAFTLQTGRSEFIHRRVVACRDPREGATALESRDATRVFTQQQQLESPPVVFMFPGQGAQYAGMGAELYRSEPVFRVEVDRCAEILAPFLGMDVRTLLFPARNSESEEEAGDRLRQTRFTQPALFTIEYALARLWMSWGITPAAMIGHSVGEYVAGCLAEVFSLEDALALVARRGELVQALPGGAMLAVRLPEAEVTPLLDEQLAIAAINSPSLCVVSGPHDRIATLETRLASKEVVTRHLHTSHAFHSPMMEPVLAPFIELLRAGKLGVPKIPFVSNVTGRWITAAEAQSASYWARHIRDTVRFADGLAELLKVPSNVLLEVGPGQTLATLTRQHPARAADQLVLASLTLTGNEEPRGVLESLGRLWMAGSAIDWRAFYANEQRRRVVLPTYPFERRRYWPEPGRAVQEIQQPQTPRPAASATAETALVEPAASRVERLVAAVRALFQELSGYDLSRVDASTDLLEFGFDSLLLTQAATLFQRKFGVRITFRQLMEELSTLHAIASHLDGRLPPEAFAPAPVVSPRPAATEPVVSGVPPGVLEQLLQQQQQLTNQLLQLMGKAPEAVAPSALTQAAPPAASSAVPGGPKSDNTSHGPFKPMDRAAGNALSPVQSRALEALVGRYTRRTAGSKRLVAENRSVLADPRSAAGFKQSWKEMVYPIVTNRSDGSKVWDIDGNEYVDFLMGFGASLFGHRPPFVAQAVHEQLDRGFEIGPIQPLAGEVAALVREFTGMERVAFTNTGSEAVLAATRISRTVTGRDKIAVFAGAYHGIFDEVLFRPLTRDGEPRAAAIAPGIPENALGQLIVLDYGNPEALEYLKAHGSDIAAVLVEPVQSRRLDLQPKEFLRELRRITEQTGSALIFDEVVTGFRVHPGGAQAHFGVRADLATYGKVVGGGLPIGVVTGTAKFMDALDGGKWAYGDASFPEVGVTFFAGTFVRHPLILAAAKAVLLHLKAQGPALQERLNERTARLAGELQEILNEFDAPYHLTQFSSLIHLTYGGDQKLAGLLFYLLRDRGMHVFENRAFVITTAHREEDFAALTCAFRESLAEMRSSGFLGASSPSATTRALPASHRGPSSNPFPLTEAQKEIWVAAQMGGNSAVAYNESLSLSFTGPFEVELFRAAARQVAARHPVLLGALSEDGQSQHLNPDATLDLPLFDLSGGSESERQAGLAELVARDGSDPFDLVRGPLLRVRIVRLSPEHHVVVWTAHHVVCDGWSGGLVISELSKIYTALKQGAVPALEPPDAFSEYACAAQGESSEAQSAAEYWRRRFADIPAPLDLPTDHARPLVRTAKALTARRIFKSATYEAAKRMAAQQRTTMVVLLMAAMKTLLHRLTGQSDLVVGLGVAGQAISGTSNLVGHCLNLLPVRTKLDGEASFRENLAAVKASVLEAYDNHQTTVGEIIRHLKVPRTTNRPPLVEVIFNVDRDPGAVKFEGVELSLERNPKHALHYDLFFNFIESAGGLCLECDYNADLFEPATIERWLGHFETLTESIAANPSDLVGKLPILTRSERAALVQGFNPAGVEYQRALTLYEWFEVLVNRGSSAPALSCGDLTLTYDELNRRANQLAHRLTALGVGPDALVALFVERSIETVVGVLGILKAGGAYLPIDPAWPRDRVAFMLQDAGICVILTNESLATELPASTIPLVCFDRDAALLERESEANLPRRSAPENLAYVIYTSGSTGKPKGTLVSHHNVVRLMQATESWYRFDATDVWTLFHSHAFDFSVWEMWGALLYGGRLVVVPHVTSRSPEDFYRLLVNERVTVLNQTPSAFRQLMQAEEALGASPDLALRHVIFGGEALEMSSLKPWFDRHGDRAPQLVNMYGITETTVHVTYRPLSADDVSAGSVVGVPIPDLQVYILDAYREPVPIGVTGEIYVGGPGVAVGYLGREELTQQRFVPDVLRGNLGGRLYRSGDLGRYLANGDIEYLGRIDHQVKIRGFRIELGEIEAVLGRHERIRQAVVIASGEGTGETMLVAYVEPMSGSLPSDRELRAYLKRELPDYMVPSVFVAMERIPLTVNGKVDRKALPAPGTSRPNDVLQHLAPRDPVEQMLALLWSKLLNVNRVGVNDNFFELGGHSILAVRLMLEIEKRFKKRLPLATLLQAPTVAQLAHVLRKENWQPSWSSLVPVQPAGSKPPLFLMHSHGGNVLEYYPLARHLDPDQPVFALQARGLDGRIVKGQSLEQMATAYLSEVRSLQPAGPYFLGGFCFGGLLALEAARQLTAAGEEVALVAMIQTIRPAVAKFKPDITFVERLWFRTTKRLDLERENLRHQGHRYLRERSKRIWDFARAKIAMTMDRLNTNGERQREAPSLAYIIEALGAEHDQVFDRYTPTAYEGDVVLFRATKQLKGLLADQSLGWKGIVQGNFGICDVDGHQQNMLLEPHVARLAAELEVRLQAAQRRFEAAASVAKLGAA